MITPSWQALPEDAGRDLEVLLALSLLRQQRTVNASTLAVVLQRTAPEAQQVLARMASEPRIVEATLRTATSPTPNYRLMPEALAGMGSAVRYHTPSLGARDRKVIEHVGEYGFITNATLRRLFDIDVYTARNLLRSLQDRGVLQKIGEQAYGPKVRYGQGPRSQEDR